MNYKVRKESMPYSIKEWLEYHLRMGCTYQEIGDVFGVCRQCICNYAARLGVRRKKDLSIGVRKTQDVRGEEQALKQGFVIIRQKSPRGRVLKSTYSNSFEVINSREKAYWLGFLMADGNVGQGRIVLSLRLGPKDREHVYKFRYFVGGGRGVRLVQSGYNITICGTNICNDLDKYGMIPAKGGKEQIKNISKKYYNDFIRGYFDGDGGISTGTYQTLRKGKNISLSISICSMSKKILRQIAEIIFQTIQVKMNSSLKHKDYRCHSIYCMGEKALKVLGWLYANTNQSIRLDRKYRKFLFFLICRISHSTPYSKIFQLAKKQYRKFFKNPLDKDAQLVYNTYNKSIKWQK